MDTEEAAADTKYIVPRYPDSYIVNNGLPFTVGTDVNGTKAGWVVTLAEDRYRFTVDMTKRTLKGELFDAWDELFLVGGAASCGWESYIMLPFTRVEGERCTYTWTGELKNRTENVEPRRFKLTGQNAWEPKHLHPFTQDESPLTTTQLRTGGDDTKWQIAADGWYRITVDDDEKLIDWYPSSAEKGERVTIHTMSVTDADLVVTVSGAEDGRFVREGVYEFTMPAQDVKITAYADTSGYPGA